MKKLPEFVRYQFPALLWMILIFILSSVPEQALSNYEFPYAHLIAHVALYGSLYYLSYRALRYQNFSSMLSKYRVAGALLIVVLYGASDEFHQSFTPGRSPELKDLLIDVVAGAIVLACVASTEYSRKWK